MSFYSSFLLKPHRSTYATTYRDSKYAREREFLKAVHNCVGGGGKVLIPSFALGRAQELCMLLDDYWERMNLKVPIYFSAGLTIQANMYYKMLINWTSQKVKDSYTTRNAFDFKHVCSFDRSLINAPGPCVLFATPGMISGGFSLEVFKQWAPYERNLITLPGYCVAGTVGHKLMSAKIPMQISIDRDTQIDVRCQIHQLSFSPHTDAKGITDLIKFLSPKHVILVHGEKPKMESLKGKIESDFKIRCYVPANNETVSIPSAHYVKAHASSVFLKSTSSPNFKFLKASFQGNSSSNIVDMIDKPFLRVCDDRAAEGILFTQRGRDPKLLHQNELKIFSEEKTHEVQYALCLPVKVNNMDDESRKVTVSSSEEFGPQTSNKKLWQLQQLFVELSKVFSEMTILDYDEYLQMESFVVCVCQKDKCPYRETGDSQNISVSKTVFFCCKWSLADKDLAWKVISAMKDLELRNL